MKPKLKFGVLDIVLCVLLVALIGVNIYAYSGDSSTEISKGDTGKPTASSKASSSAPSKTSVTDSSKASVQTPSETSAPDSSKTTPSETSVTDDDKPVALANSEVTADVVAGERRMNLFFCHDDSYETWYIMYELDITLTEITRDVYRIDVTTADAVCSDGSGDGLDMMEGTATGTVEDGILCFILPGLESAPLHLTYLRFGDEIAAIAYEKDYLTTAYYAVEMYLPE